MVGQAVVHAVGTVEVVHRHRHDGRQWGHRQECPARHGQVPGADQVAAVDAVGPVQAGRVHQDRVIGHAEAEGSPGEDRLHAGQRPADPFRQRHRGVVGRRDEQAVQQLVGGPDAVLLHEQLVRRRGRGGGAHRDRGVRCQVAGRQGGDHLGQAGRGQGGVVVARVDHVAGVGVDHDPRLGDRRGRGRGRGGAGGEDPAGGGRGPGRWRPRRPTAGVGTTPAPDRPDDGYQREHGPTRESPTKPRAVRHDSPTLANRPSWEPACPRHCGRHEAASRRGRASVGRRGCCCRHRLDL